MLYYLISDPLYYTDDPKKLSTILEKTLQNHQVDMLCFRDKQSSNFEQLAKAFLDTSKQFINKKVLLNTDINLAKNLGFDGVHLTSKQFGDIEFAKELGLFVIISCHSENELQMAIDNKADMVTYSPIFTTPNKGLPKGIENLKRVSNNYNIPIIALGGIIDYNQVSIIETTNVEGFASIRYFIN